MQLYEQLKGMNQNRIPEQMLGWIPTGKKAQMLT